MTSFNELEYGGKRKTTRREVFLGEMEVVVPWRALCTLIEPHYPKAGKGRRPYALETMLRIHLLQNWFNLSDPAMEEALYDMPLMRQFAALARGRIPDETTILNFRHLLEVHSLAPKIFALINADLSDKGLLLKRGTMVDATIIAAAPSTKNAQKDRDPEMHQTKKGNQWHFGMKAHIGVDVQSGLVHTVVGTAANESDVKHIGALLHGEEKAVHADAGYTGAAKYLGDQAPEQYIAAKRSVVEAMDEGEWKAEVKRFETLKAKIRARVEHPFRVLKRQFGYVKVRYQGLAKNTARVITLFALSNLWMVRRKLMAMADIANKTGALRPQEAN